MKTAKCDKCKSVEFVDDLFVYGETRKDGHIYEINVCENCLFDVIENEFCTEDF